MNRINIIMMITFAMAGLSAAEVSLEMHDRNGLIYSGGDVMVGEKLEIYVKSDSLDDAAIMSELIIEETYQPHGMLAARDFNEVTSIYEGSVLPAAGSFDEGAAVMDNNETGKRGLQFSSGFDAQPGMWFVIDFEALEAGTCQVQFLVDFEVLEYLTINIVPSRDYDGDGRVNLKDFSTLGRNWFKSDCQSPDYCDGSDLDEDGTVDGADLADFMNYWLF